MKTNIGVHAPNNFSAYEQIHETVIDQFRDSLFINDHTLEFSAGRRFDDISDEVIPQIRLKGQIGCQGKILITVDKFLDILDNSGNNRLVQTFSYSYNASVQGFGNIFRYDNLDDYFVVNSGHPDNHHRHNFNWCVNQQKWQDLTWVGYDNWPTLGKVITELQEWYWDNKDELANYVDDVDGYPILGLGWD
ncbi:MULTISPECIES: hypothetical protein [unclassified Nostoc]|uniref:hypothetical protein n=1 Tax=unclassified Nostoc TaxID=2593658 RepID=UPI0025D196D0|nr:hypothetical protein [Nostoc sp. JL23]